MPPIVDGVSYINIATGHVNVLMRLYTFVYFSCDYSELRRAIAQSQRTTFTSNMFAGSEIQPYSPESHEKPPLIMVPTTPTQGVRAPTTSWIMSVWIFKASLDGTLHNLTSIVRRCFLQFTIDLCLCLSSADGHQFRMLVEVKIIEGRSAHEDVLCWRGHKAMSVNSKFQARRV